MNNIFKKFFVFALGALSAAAFAPFYSWLALSIGVTAFLLLLDQASSLKHVFWTGWWWGFGFFTAGLYWISFSLGVDLGKFFWLLPFSIFGIPAFFALFTGFLGLLTVSGSNPGAKRWILFAVSWCLMEWVRGHILTGFPWNLAAYTWAQIPCLRQYVAEIGPYGLGFFTLLGLSTPYLFLRKNAQRGEKKAASLFVFLTFLGAWQSGKNYITQFPTEEIPDVWIRIVQPNVPQKEKQKPHKRQQQLQDLVALSLQPSSQSLTHIIWPEAAIPFYLNVVTGLEGMLPLLPPQGALIAGAGRRGDFPDRTGTRVWNSFWVLTSSGAISAVYDKSHLVPFGEYVPLRAALNQWIDTSWLSKITAGHMDFSPGNGLQTLMIPGAPSVSPLICYEAIFPGQVVGNIRPGWLLNLTNDAWFGDTTGPYQHLDSARFRAIEEGLPLVRAANTGISAIIDPHGEILQSLPLNKKGILDFVLPKALQLTLYSRWGEGFFWIYLLGFLLMATLLDPVFRCAMVRDKKMG